MDISTIATYDWPEEWPELVPYLLKLISDQKNISGVHRALRCLALLSGDLDDKEVPSNIIQSNGGITTRSKARSAPEQWTVIPLPMKILALLADTLIVIQEQVWEVKMRRVNGKKSMKEALKLRKNMLLSTDASQLSKPTYDQLEAMARFENQDDGVDDLLGNDPLNECFYLGNKQINLASYVADFLLKFSSEYQPLFNDLFQGLTDAQRNVIRTVLNR